MSETRLYVYHAFSLSLYSASTPFTASSCITVSLNSADVSRRAFGRMQFVIISSRQPGGGTTSRLLPKLPYVGLARWNAMRTCGGGGEARESAGRHAPR